MNEPAPGKPVQFAFNDVAQYLLVLLLAKALKSLGIYMCYDLLKVDYPLRFLSINRCLTFFLFLAHTPRATSLLRLADRLHILCRPAAAVQRESQDQ